MLEVKTVISSHIEEPTLTFTFQVKFISFEAISMSLSINLQVTSHEIVQALEVIT